MNACLKNQHAKSKLSSFFIYNILFISPKSSPSNSAIQGVDLTNFSIVKILLLRNLNLKIHWLSSFLGLLNITLLFSLRHSIVLWEPAKYCLISRVHTEAKFYGRWSWRAFILFVTLMLFKRMVKTSTARYQCHHNDFWKKLKTASDIVWG